MGGKINTSNGKYPGGSIFTLRLPVPQKVTLPEGAYDNESIRILTVDDEQPIRKLLRTGLMVEGYTVIGARNGREALEIVANKPPDLIILDLGLPDLQGHDVLQQWRASDLNVPVIILSSRTDESGIVRALELGADDYVTKPFGMTELAARIRVALRHRLQTQGEKPIFQAGELSVDLVRRIVRLGVREVKLFPKEYDILRILVQHAGKVITHQYLLKQVWEDNAEVQNLRVYVRQLRQKIEDSADQPIYITTETGVGYRMREANCPLKPFAEFILAECGSEFEAASSVNSL